MSTGLLAWWHHRVTSFGLAGAALSVVPVAVAAMIGLAAGLSGIASGLTSLTSGPDTDPASVQVQSRQAEADGSWELASKSTLSVGSNSGGGSAAIDPGVGPTGAGKVLRTGGTGDSGGGSTASTISAPGDSGGSSGSGGGSSDSPTSSSPGIDLPGLGGANDTVNNTVSGVNNTVSGVNDTVSGVNDTVDSTVDSVNNTVGGAENTVNNLLP
jgi:hypothetical protein